MTVNGLHLCTAFLVLLMIQSASQSSAFFPFLMQHFFDDTSLVLCESHIIYTIWGYVFFQRTLWHVDRTSRGLNHQPFG